MKKIIILLLLLEGLLPCLLAQPTVLMGSQTTVNNCGFIIYDNGGQSGDYAANVDQTLTIHSNDPGNGCVMVEIQNLDIDPSDTLIFYDGVGTGGTELHRINNSNYDPTGTFRYAATIQNSTGALTIRFVSDSAGGGAGFTIFASCMAPCQRVEIHLDTIHSSHKPHIDPDDGYYYVDVCPYDTVHFVAYCDYPDNNFSYPQSHALTTFMWDFDLSEVDSLGLTTVDHYFTPGRGYDVAISAVDSAHCPSLIPVTFRVRTSKNPIRDVAQLPPICAGQQLDLSVGYDHLSSVQLDSIGSEQITSLGVTDTVFLPDGINCPPYGYYYRSYVNFTAFAPNATITSANDILYVRLKIEHSAIEDIRIKLYCPNGSSVRIVPDYQNDGWGGVTHNFRTNLGLANRLQEVTTCDASQNPMGVAWNYVWSNNTTLGYQYANSPYGYCFEPQNVHVTANPYWDNSNGLGMYSYVIDSTDVANMTQVYHPSQNFSNLVGCPLNGSWFIEVQDLWTNDNGYIHEWEMALDPHLLPQNWSYTVNVDTTYIVGPGSNGMYVIPDTAGTLYYTAYVIDEYGCSYDTIVPLTVVSAPHPELGEDFSLCHGDMITLDVDYDAPGTTYMWNTGDETESIIVLSEGTYIVNIVTTDDSAGLSCSGRDSIHVASLPNPNVDFALSDTSGCAPLVVRTTNLTSPAGLDCTYSWMILNEDGTLAYASLMEEPAFEIDDPGTYSIALWATSADGCRDSLFKWNYIHVHPQPVAEFTAVPEISLFQESNGTIEFQSYTDLNILNNEGTTILWDFDDGTTDSASISPTHTYASWGDYNVTLSINSGFGCTSEITHTVTIEDNLIFPNVITPNGDNLNDVFAIENLNTNINLEDPDQYRSNELYIYDRWGKLVYKAKNYDTVSKDGQIMRGAQCFDALNLPDGVYYYSFYYKGKVKVVNYNGTLTVIR